jgi:ketol-acid reductoisomerase
LVSLRVARRYFKNDTLAMIGYGSQGHGQSLNARDNGLKVIVGVRKGGESWKQAQEDGWVEGETLFSIEEAIGRGTIIMNLLSDAAQSQTWNEIKPLITKDKTLYFAHGFSVVFKEDVSLSFPALHYLSQTPAHELTRIFLYPEFDDDL